MTTNQELSAEEQLRYIQSVIAQSRQSFAEDGKPYIVWGIIVTLGMLDTYISALLRQDLATGYVWIGLVIVGWAYVFRYSRRCAKDQRQPTVIDRMQSGIWGAVGSMIGLVLALVFASQMLDIAGVDFPPMYICFVVALLTGIGYYLSGIVNELRWMQYVGFVWWAGAVVMFLWPSIHILGLYAVMMLAFQVVPGIILYRRYRQSLPAGSVVATS